MPALSYSAFEKPAPSPSSTRPFETASSVAISFASIAGCR